MDDLRRALSSLDSIEVPEQWNKIEKRARTIAAQTPPAAGHRPDAPLHSIDGRRAPTVIRRNRNMFSPLTATTAGVLAVAIGGALLISQPFQSQPQVVPGAASASPTSSSREDPLPQPVSMTWNVPYMTIDGRELYLDIYAPTSDGPWPVVVTFHTLGARDERNTHTVAKEAAAQGLLVFNPTWINSDTFPPTADNLGVIKQAASCAVAFAQQQAPELGGDPNRTAVHGFEAGFLPAMWAVLDPVEGPIPGCATDASPTPITAVVSGVGDYFLYTEVFDDAFDSDPVALQAHAATLVDPAEWPAGLDAEFFLWTAEDGTVPGTIRDVADETGFLPQRDPTGSIRADLQRLGQLDDGVVTLADAGRLMADRLASAGLEVTLDEFPGDHTTLDKVSELIGYLQAAITE